MPSATSVAVDDPSGAAVDPALPSLALALDPEAAERELSRLPVFGAVAPVRLAAVRVVRHKPQRRCLVAYDVQGYGTVYGKVQRRRYGKSGFRLAAALRDAGFDGDIAVPEPLGVIGAFRMWLQAEAAGIPVTTRLHDPALARRVADAAHKLHCAAVPADRSHTAADELAILGDCFAAVALAHPDLASRLRGLLDRCEQLARQLAGSPTCGIHRDFYADQVLVDGTRLTLVDFDLYCEGDPALDIGNFSGHVVEQALREHGASEHFDTFDVELHARFRELAGAEAAGRARAWAALTLARHVYLSTQFAERRAYTLRTLDLAEQRVDEVLR